MSLQGLVLNVGLALIAPHAEVHQAHRKEVACQSQSGPDEKMG